MGKTSGQQAICKVFGKSEIIHGFSTVRGNWHPNPYIAHGSTVL